MKKDTLLLLLFVALVGCGRPYVRESNIGRSVKVFRSFDEIKNPYTDLGEITINGAYTVNSASELIKELQVRAYTKGADAIVVGRVGIEWAHAEAIKFK